MNQPSAADAFCNQPRKKRGPQGWDNLLGGGRTKVRSADVHAVQNVMRGFGMSEKQIAKAFEECAEIVA